MTIGIMLGIQFIAALGEFGAQSQVVVAVAKSVTREFGALITAILVAGRSGSSLAARIGSMTVSQEVDASRDNRHRSGALPRRASPDRDAGDSSQSSRYSPTSSRSAAPPCTPRRR
jgi:hypothetical protein